MSKKIIQLNEEVIKSDLKELVRNSVEETLNKLLEEEAKELTNAAKYERTKERQGYQSGHYNRNLTTSSGDVNLKMPKLKGVSFETAIIERYRRREQCGRIVDRNVFGRGICTENRRYHRNTMGK
jgi:Transposase and inactivated derivatives